MHGFTLSIIGALILFTSAIYSPQARDRHSKAIVTPVVLARSVAHSEPPDYVQLFPHVFARQGPPVNKVALTFDDGPDQIYTPKILDVLKREHAKATFFLLGSQVERHPGMVRRILQEGHAIGNHSFDHRDLARLSASDLTREVNQTDWQIYRSSGLHTHWFRAPYGSVNQDVLNQLGRMGYHVINWTVDSNDWRSLSALQVKKNVLQHIVPGAIILQHCAGGDKEILTGTVQALPIIIRTLRRQGYELVTIPELLGPEARPVHGGRASGARP